ncbi:hypothetical protein BY458DRAFT_531768 [Sporodiniella umbellata]|nr:hypothetical protein BY458DRAFT_531768 [Sporodiniella umbellata]
MMQERRGIYDLSTKQSMESWTFEKKRLMINQEHQAEHSISTLSSQQEDWIKPHASQSTPIAYRNPKPILTSSQSTLLASKPVRKKQARLSKDQNTPEFFVQKFLGPGLNHITTSIAARLEVSLRTRSIDWVAAFIQLKGYHVLSYALDYLNHTTHYRKDTTLELEVEIVKCIKAIMNTKIGKQETMNHPEYIHAVVFSILCPFWQTKKLVCELLAFLCYSDGYEHIMRGFEMLRKFRKDLGLFDSWMRDFQKTTANENNRISSRHLFDYTLSNIILVNALVKIPSDVNDRIYITNQLNLSVFPAVLPILESFDFHLLDIQLRSFMETVESDKEEAFGENQPLYTDLSQPFDLFERILEGLVNAPRALEQLIFLLKSLLWIQGDPDTMYRYYHIIQTVAQQIVMDQRPHEITQSLSTAFDVAVGAVIQTQCGSGRSKETDPQVSHLEAQLELLSGQKKVLEAEIAKLRILPTQLEIQEQEKRIQQLQEENSSLRGLLKTSKATITMLQLHSVEENVQKNTVNYMSSPKSPGMLGKSIMNASSLAFGNFLSPLFHKRSARKLLSDTCSLEQEEKSLDTLFTESSSNRDSSSSSYQSSDKAFSYPASSPKIPIPPASAPSRRELTYYPQNKLKHLQWQKLDSISTKQTVWESEEDLQPIFEDALGTNGAFDMLDTLFTAKSNDLFERRLQSKQEAENEAIKFLKKEKNRNIKNFLTNLLTYLPDKSDDLVSLERYMGSTEEARETLDLPEQFTVEMMSIYRYEPRLKYMLFRVQFWERFERLKSSLSIVLSASDALCDSYSWRKLLLLILTLGNYMNASSLQGGAYGFRIASINKLVDTKANDKSRLTLLHVLIGIVRKQFPPILTFVEDVKDVPQAARSLKQLSLELDSHWKDSQVDLNQDRFYVVMQEYRRSVIERFEEVEVLYLNMDAKWKHLMLFYGESPQQMRPDEFFQIFSKFISSWKTAILEEINYTQAKEQEERRLKEIQGPTIVKPKQIGQDGPLVDDLLAKLRSGESLTKSKKRKTQKPILPKNPYHRNSSSSTTSFTPSISAERLLRSLQADK